MPIYGVAGIPSRQPASHIHITNGIASDVASPARPGVDKTQNNYDRQNRSWWTFAAQSHDALRQIFHAVCLIKVTTRAASDIGTTPRKRPDHRLGISHQSHVAARN